MIADSVSGNDLVIANNGNIYVTSPDGATKPGKVYLIRPNGEKLVVEDGLKFPNGVTVSPDQTQLYVTESATHWVWIYKIQKDGTLAYKQRYGWLHSPDTEDNAWTDGIRCDTAGRMFVASRLGVQILISWAEWKRYFQYLLKWTSFKRLFWGSDFNVLYVSAGDKVFRRKLKTRGVNSFDKPIKPANPRL